MHIIVTKKHRIKNNKKCLKENKIDNPVIIVALLGICATLFGILAYHRLTLWRNSKERCNDTYEAFKASFIPSIQILSKEPLTFRPDDFVTFQKLFISQNTAKLKLTDTMNNRNLNRFNSKWQEYKDWQDNCNTYERTVMTIGIASNRECVLKVINELLDIAKYY